MFLWFCIYTLEKKWKSQPAEADRKHLPTPWALEGFTMSLNPNHGLPFAGIERTDILEPNTYLTEKVKIKQPDLPNSKLHT